MYTLLRMPVCELLVQIELRRLPLSAIPLMVRVYVRVGRVDRAVRLLREARAWGLLVGRQG